MSNVKHTPGPWTVGEATWSENGFATYELRGVGEICAADASLIAAAPDLLEALEGLLLAGLPVSRNEPAGKACELARAAIKKARGENA